MTPYIEEINEVLVDMHSGKDGLSDISAKKLLEQNGKNVLEQSKNKSTFRKFLEQFCDPMIIILLCAAIVSGVLAVIQNDSFADVIIIMAVVIANAILGVYQENKAEAALEELQKMSASNSRVVRDGVVKEIPSSDLVLGDIVLLEAGDSVPADGRIIDAATLKIEEAALTGESLAVNKLINVMMLKDNEKDVPLAERKNMAYMGTNVVYGRGTMCVTATGMDTEMGKIAGALQTAKDTKTPLQIKMAQLSKVLT